eukprot:TRINITY_DN5580_c0_g1_i1.p1 TRINITY_DN5580_c0_g1~~TRINITY_DN5580_c0_g1_i1.p1  ORF type:complete len:185 (+),score=0.75 TRINITY_DN5580_c0_g1_i1:18-572(+)
MSSLTDFEKAGKELLASQPRAYHGMDVIWEDSETKGKVYVGNAMSAQDKPGLQAKNVKNIVNCQGRQTANYHEADATFQYLRFPVSQWYEKGALAQPEEVLRYWAPCFQWIEDRIQKGENVLVHCLAGAHRAGTVGVAWLMHKHGWGYQKAREEAKERRPIINPMGHLEEILFKLENAQKDKGC